MKGRFPAPPKRPMLLVPGHALRFEGALRFNAAGVDVTYWGAGPMHAACTCGALSPPEVTTASGAKTWHASHKRAVLAEQVAP